MRRTANILDYRFGRLNSDGRECGGGGGGGDNDGVAPGPVEQSMLAGLRAKR